MVNFMFSQYRYVYFVLVVLMLIPLMFSLANISKIQDFQNADFLAKNHNRRSLLLHSSESNDSDSNSKEALLNVPGAELIPLTKDIYVAGFSNASPDICPNLGENRSLLIMVTSAPPNEPSRMEIRKNWGSYAKRLNISIGFIIGFTDNKTYIDAMRKEQEIYHDLVITKSVDTYNNLTLKTVAVMEWTKDYCSKVGFVLKTDDDVFINIFKLSEFVSRKQPSEKAIYGRLAKNWKAGRNMSSKYYISPAEFALDVFPEFTTGPAYIISRSVVSELYEEALRTKYFKLEDVFLTGIVAQKLRIKRHAIVHITNRKLSYTICNVQRVISIHPVKMQSQEELWTIALDATTKPSCRMR